MKHKPVIKHLQSYDNISFPSAHVDFNVQKGYADKHVKMFTDLVREWKAGQLFVV